MLFGSLPLSVARAELVWMLIGGYFALGFCVALALLFGWINRIDRQAGDAPKRVKLLLLPGLVALWPLLLVVMRQRETRA